MGRLRSLFSMAGITILVSSLAGCGTTTSTAKKSTGSTFINVINGNPKTLDPLTHTLLIESVADRVMFQGLYRLNRKDKWTAALATAYKVSNQGLTYTFTLRKGVKWSDGKPFTSKDVWFTWKAVTNPKIRISYATGWKNISNVTTPNKYTVVFHLKKAYAPFMANIASYSIVPYHILGKMSASQINKGSFNTHPIGTGPYMLKKWTPSAELDFVPNPYWYGPKPQISRYILKIVPNPQTAVNMLKTGAVDMVAPIAPNLLSQVKSSKNVKLAKSLQAVYGLVQLNEWHFLKDVNVRRALDWATPKKQIVQKIMHNQAIVAHGDQVPGGYWYDPNIPRRHFSLSKAASILKKDGFVKKGKWLYKNGKRLNVPIDTITGFTNYVDIAQVLSADWEKIGIYAPVTTMSLSAIFGQNGPQFNHKDAAEIFGWGQGVFPDDTIDFNSKYIPKTASSPGENGERYNNPQMNKLTVAGTSTVSRTARKKIYDKIQLLEHQTVPLIFLYWLDGYTAINKNLHGYKQNVFGSSPIWTWRFTGK